MNFTEIRFADKEETTWTVKPDMMQIGVDATDNRHHTQVLEDIANGAVVQSWVDPMTPYQHWHNDISTLDKDMPRYLEDHITNGHDGDANNEFLQVRYDAKIKLRATKP